MILGERYYVRLSSVCNVVERFGNILHRLIAWDSDSLYYVLEKNSKRFKVTVQVKWKGV